MQESQSLQQARQMFPAADVFPQMQPLLTLRAYFANNILGDCERADILTIMALAMKIADKIKAN